MDCFKDLINNDRLFIGNFGLGERSNNLSIQNSQFIDNIGV